MHSITSTFSCISLLCISDSKDTLPTLVVDGNVGVGIPSWTSIEQTQQCQLFLSRVIKQQCIIANFSASIWLSILLLDRCKKKFMVSERIVLGQHRICVGEEIH